MIVDTHVHIWEISDKYPIGPTAPTRNTYPDEPGTAEELLADMDANNVDWTVLVQTSWSTWDNGYIADSTTPPTESRTCLCRSEEGPHFQTFWIQGIAARRGPVNRPVSKWVMPSTATNSTEAPLSLIWLIAVSVGPNGTTSS